MATETKEAKTLYGPRKIGQKAFELQKQQQKLSKRGATVYGHRKGGGTRAGDVEHVEVDPIEGGNPFIGEDGEVVTISEMKVILNDHPELLDLAVETEVEQAEPRVGAIRHLKRLEGERDGGPREGLVELLDRLTG